MSRIVVAGTFDSKSAPLSLLVGMLRERGENPIVIDTSVFPTDSCADYTGRMVAERIGREQSDLASLGRASAVNAMSKGAAAILTSLAAERQVGALVCMGGSNAAAIFVRLSATLPLGIPKLLMSTSTAGDTRPLVGASDVVMLYPVVDIDGDNRILRRMVERLADAATATKSGRTFADGERKQTSVALTMYGVTTPCVQRVSAMIEEAGMEPFVFHANGTGGRSVEAFASQGIVDAVVDATLAELGNDLLGGAFPAGPDRMTGASAAGVPQVIAPGAVDMIAFGPRRTVPETFEHHAMLAHNELVTLVRTTPDECRRIGADLAERLGAPKARTIVCIPHGGTSMLDKDGAEFRDPGAVAAFQEGLARNADASITILESRHNINDPEFADLLFEQLNVVMES